MNPHREVLARWPVLLVLACFLTPGGQLRSQTVPPRDTLIAVAQEMMEAARYCALITIDESGQPRVRTMDPFSPEEGMVVWMGTDRDTRKVRDIEKDPRVTLYYFVPEEGGYVSIAGTARLVDDPGEKSRRWKSEWEPFYPDRDADYVLIAVDPQRIEVVSNSRGITGDPETWIPPIVEFGG
jgi:general stress protein 26